MEYRDKLYAFAKKMREEYPSLFSEKEFWIDDYCLKIYCYRLVDYDLFKIPETKELRGICFILKNNVLVSHHLMLPKFFNVGETSDTSLEVLNKKEIRAVYDKLDGSLISFLKLPNGKLLPRTIKSIDDNEQTDLVLKFINENPNYKELIEEYLKKDINLFFELTSPLNPIVVSYDKTNLVLLKARNNITGEFIDLSTLDIKDIDIAKSFNYSLEQMLSLKEYITDTEGWVIDFGDVIAKLKTDWYNSLHHVATETTLRENEIFELYLDNKIDDLLPSIKTLNPMVQERFFNNLNIVKEVVNKLYKLTKDKLKNYSGDRKKFALENKKDKLFPLYMQSINSDVFDATKKFVLKRTNKLHQARGFIKMVSEY